MHSWTLPIEEEISLCTNLSTDPKDTLGRLKVSEYFVMHPGLLFLAYLGDPYATAPGLSNVNEPVFLTVSPIAKMCSVSLWLSHASLTDLITSEWSGNIMFRPASFSLSLLLSLSPHPSLSFSLCLCLSFCLFLSLALIGISISLTGTNYGPNNGPPMPTEVIYDDHTTWSNIFADYYAACF